MDIASFHKMIRLKNLFSSRVTSLLIPFLLLLILWCGTASQGVAQKKFNLNPGGFVEEMTSWLTKEFDRDKAMIDSTQRFMSNFAAKWNFAFTLDQQMMVINTCNVMMKKRMRANPHYMEYLKTALLMAGSGHSELSYTAWSSSVMHIAERRQRDFMPFLKFTEDLIERQLIYSSNIHTWKTTGTDTEFFFEEGKIRVSFRTTDLICYAFNDSTVIYGTEGVYDPVLNRWTGDGGKVTWERVGFPAEEVYAVIGSYDLRTTQSRFSADSVMFFNTRLFPDPQPGKIADNVQQFRDTASASYPRFDSYHKRYVIPNMFPDVDYEGGYAYRGARFMGTGSLDNPASFSFKYRNKEAVRITSPSFTIRENRISSLMATLVIYLDDDSIYHPGLEVSYRAESRLLSAYTVQIGTGESRFFNTFHGVDMAAAELHWNMNEGKIKLQTSAGMSGASEAYFESRDFYSKRNFDRLMGMDAAHPLIAIRQYWQSVNRRPITLEEYARFLRISSDQVMMQLIMLANYGYIHYDIDQGEFQVLPKLANTLMAFGGVRDYDVINFYSATQAGNPNALIDLETMNMDVFGLQDRIQLSDSQFVFIEPDQGRITMQKNRSFLFSGMMRVGNFRFVVKDAAFNYDDFAIDAPDIQSMTFSVESFDPNDYDVRGERRRYWVRTELTDLSGRIAIDDPRNKSGVQDHPQFPIFTCTTDAYAYYDSKDIHRGTYVRDGFYYKIDPFEIDSLSSFSTEGFMLYGAFHSAGIFPVLTPPLQVRPDYSLGFVYETPPSGLPAYNGVGTFTQTLDLSNQGFYGNGQLNYLTSTGHSEAFLFTPDSTIAECKSYVVIEKEGDVGFPALSASEVNMRWKPYDDRMDINHKDRYRRLKENPMMMFAGRADLHGDFWLTSAGSGGRGAMVIKDAELDSKEFIYGMRTIDAASADFRLKATYADLEVGILPRDGYELLTYDYTAHVDFNKELGSFVANGGGSIVSFLINQYIATVDKFEWHMNRETIRFENTSATDIPDLAGLTLEEILDKEPVGTEFISTSPFQDSLRFHAVDALYNRKTYVIEASGVPYIRVADAAIYPDRQKVNIFRKAELDTLQNARILTNTITRYHQFQKVTASIQTRNRYEASGVYDYIDHTNSLQKINFQRIYADRSAHTTGEGSVAEEDGFYLSPRFGFQGEVVLRSASKHLTYIGGAQISHVCDTLQREWFRFTAEIDPENVMIPVSRKPVNLMQRDLGVGLLVSRDTVDIYAAFLNRKHRAPDREIIYANGFILFDEETQEYRVSNRAKLEDIYSPGNYVSLNTQECTVYGEGKMAIGEDLGLVNMDALGKATFDIATDSLELELILSLDFFFSEQALRVFSRDLESAGGMGVSLNNEAYIYAVHHWLGSSAAETLENEIMLYGAPRRIPPEMQKTIIFTDIQLAYNRITRSFLYQGPIGIGNVKDRQINRYVDGKIEIKRERTGDVFTILLEVDEETWYLFDYSRGRMMALSGNVQFNKAIRETKTKHRRIQDEKTKEMYMFTLSTPRKKRSFERQFLLLEED